MKKKQKTTILYILDEETKFIVPDDGNSIQVLNESDLNTHIPSHLDETKAVVILAELKWEGKWLQEFYGFQIAAELRRRYKYLGQIIIVSSFKPSLFENYSDKNPAKYNILFARGTGFVDISDFVGIKNQLLLNPSISKAVLSDINEMLLEIKGYIIDKIQHDLRFDMGNEALEKALSNIEIYVGSSGLNYEEWKLFSDKLKAGRSDSDIFNQAKESFIQRISSSPKVNSSGPMGHGEKRHKILVLEDDKQFLRNIENSLNNHFAELITTSDAEKAIEILDTDKENSITGIIADWRLYYPESKYWQKQGYEVLDYAVRTRFIAPFALTSLTDNNVHNIRNELGIDIHLFKKQTLQTEGAGVWEIMADIIKQKCDAIVETISSQPTAKSWRKYQEEYIIQRATNWNIYNNGISTSADEHYEVIIKYVKELLNPGSHKSEKNVSFKGLVAEGLTLNTLWNILIVRRLFFALFLKLTYFKSFIPNEIESGLLNISPVAERDRKHHALDAYMVLRLDWWEDKIIADGVDEWDRFNDRYSNFQTALCFELTAIPTKGLLPEEKKWLLGHKIRV